MSNFTAAQATALFAAIQSYAQELSLFQAVDLHEPWNAPGNRLFCSITLGPIRPTAAASGLSAVSCTVTLMVHIWSSAMQRPLDNIDPEVLATVCSLMGAFAGGFTLGQTVRDVDLMAMTADPGYIEFEGKQFRTAVISLPIVINDMFTEVA